MATDYILVIEDTTLIRTLVSTRLQAEGYEVATAGVISEALLSIRTRMPDLLVLDLNLDGEGSFAELTDGFAFLGLLRRTYPQAGTAVIIYSVSHSPEVETRAKSLGAFAVVAKKSGMPALLETIRSALDDRKKKQAPLQRK